MSTRRDGALPGKASRLAILSLWTMLAGGLGVLVGSVATLPSIVWVVVVVALAISIPAWAVAVFRDARSNGLSVGSAIRKSVHLTWKALWELLA